MFIPFIFLFVLLFILIWLSVLNLLQRFDDIQDNFARYSTIMRPHKIPNSPPAMPALKFQICAHEMSRYWIKHQESPQWYLAKNNGITFSSHPSLHNQCTSVTIIMSETSLTIARSSIAWDCVRDGSHTSTKYLRYLQSIYFPCISLLHRFSLALPWPPWSHSKCQAKRAQWRNSPPLWRNVLLRSVSCSTFLLESIALLSSDIFYDTFSSYLDSIVHFSLNIMEGICCWVRHQCSPPHTGNVY